VCSHLDSGSAPAARPGMTPEDTARHWQFCS
jgi:hypothetical protein